MDDLNGTVNATNIAVDAILQDYPNRAMNLSNLGTWLGRRSERTRSIDNLNYTIDATNIAVDATP